jgi:hypothetical protein
MVRHPRAASRVADQDASERVFELGSAGLLITISHAAVCLQRS